MKFIIYFFRLISNGFLVSVLVDYLCKLLILLLIYIKFIFAFYLGLKLSDGLAVWVPVNLRSIGAILGIAVILLLLACLAVVLASTVFSRNEVWLTDPDIFSFDAEDAEFYEFKKHTL